MLKRTITTVVGVLIFIAVFFIDSLQLINGAFFFNIAMAICAFLMCHEFYKAIENKGFKPIKIIGYLCTLFIIPIGVISTKILMMICATIIPLIIFVGMGISVFSKMKYNVIDISVTLFGAIYTVLMMAFLSSTRALNNGVFLIFYTFGGAWSCDIMAYLIGRAFGKHHFSTVSPNKTVEGCLGGVLGTVLFYLIYSMVLKNYGIIPMELNYIYIVLSAIIVSLISQIGDFSASAIKRYAEIKDFSHLMPGHGGMLDRFDSVLFVAPVVYYIFFIVERM